MSEAETVANEGEVAAIEKAITALEMFIKLPPDKQEKIINSAKDLLSEQ